MSRTLGERRVRTDFNVSGQLAVDDIKQKTAKLIDQLEKMKGGGEVVAAGEKIRLLSLAQTAYEEAAMWAVKAETYKPEEN